MVEHDQFDAYTRIKQVQDLPSSILLVFVQLPSNDYEVAVGLDVCKLLAEHFQFNL